MVLPSSWCHQFTKVPKYEWEAKVRWRYRTLKNKLQTNHDNAFDSSYQDDFG